MISQNVSTRFGQPYPSKAGANASLVYGKQLTVPAMVVPLVDRCVLEDVIATSG